MSGLRKRGALLAAQWYGHGMGAAAVIHMRQHDWKRASYARTMGLDADEPHAWSSPSPKLDVGL